MTIGVVIQEGTERNYSTIFYSWVQLCLMILIWNENVKVNPRE